MFGKYKELKEELQQLKKYTEKLEKRTEKLEKRLEKSEETVHFFKKERQDQNERQLLEEGHLKRVDASKVNLGDTIYVYYLDNSEYVQFDVHNIELTKETPISEVGVLPPVDMYKISGRRQSCKLNSSYPVLREVSSPRGRTINLILNLKSATI